jgi:hypothetical protein
VATWRALRIDDPVLAVLRDRRLARALCVRAFEHLRAGAVERARDDVRAAAATGAAPSGAWRALALAAACGPAGTLAARTWSVLAPGARRRRRPPLAIGDR